MTYVILIYLSPQDKRNGECGVIIPCETAVKSVVPAVKALIANELVERRGFRQEDVAEILGISQSAVSKYTRKVRGCVVKIDGIEEVEPLIAKMIGLLESRKYQRAEFLRIFCQTCIAIRKRRLMCPFCRKSDPKIRIEDCDFCLTYSSVQK